MMTSPKKLLIIFAIGAISLTAGIGFLYFSESMPITEPVNKHHFQVMVNDTFGIGEKRGSAGH
jgi:hypothetical protein